MVLLAEHRPAAALVMLRAAVALGDITPATLLNLAFAEDRAGEPDRARGLMQELHAPAGLGRTAVTARRKPARRGEPQPAEAAYAARWRSTRGRSEALVALAAC